MTKRVYNRPLLYAVPLPAGTEATSLTELPDEELLRIYRQCKAAEDEVVLQANPDVIERKIGEEWMLVPSGTFAQHFNGIISLNIYSHFILKQFEKPQTLGQTLQAAHQQFDDPDRTLDLQVRMLVNDFLNLGVLGRVKEQ